MSVSETSSGLTESPAAIKFSISFFDLVKCRFWRLNHQPNFLAINLGFSGLIAIQHWNSAAVADRSIGFKLFTFLFVFAFLYAVLILINLGVQMLLVFTSKNRGLVGQMELEIRDDGLVEKTEVSESLHRWTGFQKIRLSRNYLFLYVTDGNALYVPRRIFPSDQAMAAFRDQILRHTR